MGKTITEKILQYHCKIEDIKIGDLIKAKVDFDKITVNSQKSRLLHIMSSYVNADSIMPLFRKRD